MPQIDDIGYLSATESAESVFLEGGCSSSTEPDSIVAESPQKTQGDLELGGVLCSLPEEFSLTPEHEQQASTRGLLNDWTRATCCSISEAQASLAGFSVKSGGILFKGANGQEQLRPDKPRKKSNGDPIKYETKAGEAFDAILPTSPYTPDYWDEVNLRKECYHINDVPHILITEGGWKAIYGCSNGIPTIGLLGVEMGLTGQKSDPEKQRFLIKTLRKYAEAGLGFIIAFDADAIDNPNIWNAERKLAKQLAKFDVPVRTITGFWSAGPEGETKGMDDFIQHKGIEEFRAILSKAKLFGEEGERDAPIKKEPPSPRWIAAKIAEEYGSQWKYDNEQKTWRVWNGKCWEKIEVGAFTSLVKTTLDAKNVNYRGSAYIEDCKKLLEHDLRQVRWQAWNNMQYINFSNCVLDGNKNKTLEHSPGMGFTSYLPYDYKPLQGDLGSCLEALAVNCPNVHQFFHEAMKGDKRKMLKLLAIVNALLKRRFFDLQMFVHLIGKPGSGKGKFARLCQKLVGKDNSIGCQLERLIDGSTKASLIDKQLVVFPDERKPVGIDSILSLTGGDVISYRELHTPAASAHFYGSLLICSNKPIFIGDTTGLERRLCLVDFDNPVDDDKRDHSLEAGLDEEIPALITIALSLPDSVVTQAIRGNGVNQIVEFKSKEWDMKVEVNSVAAFLNCELVLDPTATTRTGTLYDAYKAFCEAGSLSKFSITKFPRLLADILAEEKLPATRHQGRIAYFEGLRLRTDSDIHPTHSEALAGLAEGLGGTSAGLGVGLEPLSDIHQRDLRDLDTKVLAETENNDFVPDAAVNRKGNKNDDCLQSEIESNLPISSPASPANPSPVQDTSPTQVPHKSHTSPTVGSKHKEFEVGDRVVIVEHGSIHHGQKGKVADIWHSSSETDYTIALDKESHFSKVVVVSVPKVSKFPFLMAVNS